MSGDTACLRSAWECTTGYLQGYGRNTSSIRPYPNRTRFCLCKTADFPPFFASHSLKDLKRSQKILKISVAQHSSVSIHTLPKQKTSKAPAATAPTVVCGPEPF